MNLLVPWCTTEVSSPKRGKVVLDSKTLNRFNALTVYIPDTGNSRVKKQRGWGTTYINGVLGHAPLENVGIFERARSDLRPFSTEFA